MVNPTSEQREIIKVQVDQLLKQLKYGLEDSTKSPLKIDKWEDDLHEPRAQPTEMFAQLVYLARVHLQPNSNMYSATL